MVDGSFEGLQRICLSSYMIEDHLANRQDLTPKPFRQPPLLHGLANDENLIQPPRMPFADVGILIKRSCHV